MIYIDPQVTMILRHGLIHSKVIEFHFLVCSLKCVILNLEKGRSLLFDVQRDDNEIRIEF